MIGFVASEISVAFCSERRRLLSGKFIYKGFSNACGFAVSDLPFAAHHGPCFRESIHDVLEEIVLRACRHLGGPIWVNRPFETVNG